MPKKLWQKILLRVPKAGLAYRAFRWFRTVRRYKIVKLSRQWRRLQKILEENPAMIVNALKSKLVWLGICQILWSLLELWLGGGAITMEVLTSAGSGILTILLRAVTTLSLSQKKTLLKSFLAVAIVAGLASTVPAPAYAQDVTLDVDLSDLLNPVATWSSTPAATSCSSSWAGAVGASGSDTLPPVRSSTIFAIACDFAGESFATLTWVNPTENDDGSPYTNPGVTRLAWSMNGLADFECLAPAQSGDSWTDRPAGQTMHTINGLSAGTWEFRAYAVSTLGLCSGPSNTASKTTTAGATVSSSVSLTVPGAVTGLGST